MHATSPAPRRILFVENGIGYGGAIICLRHLAANLDRTQYEPWIVTGREGPEYTSIAADAHWRCIRDRHVDLTPWRKRLAVDASSPPARLLQRCARQLLARLDDVVNFLPFFVGLLLLALRLRPAVIHANNEPICNRAALLVARVLGIPSVCHVRDPLAGTYHSPWIYSLPAHYVPVSRWVQRRLVELGVPAERCTVTYDGIPLERLDVNADGASFRARHGVQPDEFAVGLVGLLIPWKGQELFLDAVALLRDELPDLRALIVGGTPVECAPYEGALRERVAREGLGDIVGFTGHVTQMDTVYNGLDVVLSASTTPEPLGTVVIEAMALGRPLVAPRHGGGAEMGDDGVTALLFEPGDANSLVDALRRLHADPALRARIGQAARIKALQAFDVARHARDVEAVYAHVLGLAT
jgi:glycosyltransferase involved in cell wall biosynthesis